MDSPSTSSLAADLRSCVEARYPLLALQSHEERRALGLLEALAKATSLPLEKLEPTADPIAVVSAIASRGERCLIAAPDMHLAWDGKPKAVRKLRELIATLEANGQTLVLVGQGIELPAELGMDTVVFDLPLPNAQFLAQILHEECQGAGLTVDREVGVRAIRSVQGLTAAAARRAFRRALQTEGAGLRAGDTSGLVDEKRRILQRTDLLEFIEAPPALETVGGLEDLKEWLVERELAFDESAREFGLPTPKGLLLVGIQGCGKSLTAKAVAQLWQLPLTRLDFGTLFTATRSPEQNLRRVVRLAEALAPMVLWVDEIDKAFSAVGHGSGSSEQLTRVFGAFITWMQEKQSPVFVVATANGVDHLPGELLRKGRFDEIFFVDLPSAAERQRILEIHLQAHGRAPGGFDLKTLADACEHFSGAELEQVVISALYRAFQKRRDLEDEDLEVSAKAIVPLYRTAEEQVKALREWAKSRARRASPDARLAELWAKTKARR